MIESVIEGRRVSIGKQSRLSLGSPRRFGACSLAAARGALVGAICIDDRRRNIGPSAAVGVATTCGEGWTKAAAYLPTGPGRSGGGGAR